MDLKQDMKKKLAIITNIPSPYRVDFFHYLQQHEKEYEIHIIYASENEDNRSWEIDREKMKNSHFLDSWTLKIPRRYDTKYIHISRGVGTLLKRLQPDVVVGSEYNPTILQAVRYCSRRGIPYVSWTDGTLHSERNISGLQKRLRRYVISHAAAYIGSSTKSREAQIAYGADPRRCFISFLTADLDKYRVESKDRQPDRILCVGSLIERKGIDLLLRALTDMEAPFTLALAGAGGEEENLRRLAEEQKLQERVEFLGYLQLDELRSQYEKSGIFVLPTREDCFALVILEAMCAGLPVICSKYADGSGDLVEDGVNGYIVDPYDAENFHSRLRELLQNPEKAAQMGQASLGMLEKFRFEQVSRGFMEAVETAQRKR